MDEEKKDDEIANRIRQKEIEIYGDHKLDLSEFNLKVENIGVYEQDPIQEDMMQFYLRNDSRFKRAYHTDATSRFIELLKKKAQLKEPLHISILGVTRSGKSVSAISIQSILMALHGRLILPEHICPNAYKFLERIQELPLEETNNTCFLRDEDKQPFGVGSLSKKTKIQDIANIVAKHNISTLSLCPIKFADTEAHYGCRTIGRNFSNKTVKLLVYNMQESKSTMLPIFCIIIPIFTKLLPEWYSKPLEKFYLAMKDNWIIDEIQGKGQDVLSDLKRKTAERFMLDEQFIGLKKRNEKLTYIRLLLGSEWASGETLEILNITEMLRRGIRFNQESKKAEDEQEKIELEQKNELKEIKKEDES